MINEYGRRLLSRRVANDAPDLPELLTDVLALDETVAWGIDLADGGAALGIAVLVNHAQPVHYISGRVIHRASESYAARARPTPGTPRVGVLAYAQECVRMNGLCR
ncbi:transposase [Streptomyces drozdowiczii]